MKTRAAHDTEEEVYSKTLFGFWIYILTDFVMFATLFATYFVLQYASNGGPSGKELFHLPWILVQTLVLLVSSFCVGLGSRALHRGHRSSVLIWFCVTFILGLGFISMEIADLTRLVRGGYTWDKSAFLSAFFTVVGTHAVHMLFALLWVLVLVLPVFWKGLTPVSIKRLMCLKLFWQFLNVIWVFIFTIVYLTGVV